MCLLKRELKETNCGHDQCKKFYMANKPMCILNPTQNLQNSILNQSPIFQGQTQPNSLNNLLNNSLQQILAPKKTNSPLRMSPQESEYEVLNKKKVKTDSFVPSGFRSLNEESARKEAENNQALAADLQNKINDMNKIPQQFMSANAMGNPLLATIFNTNGNQNTSGQLENAFSPYTNNGILLPMNQNMQQQSFGNLLGNNQAFSILQNQQGGNMNSLSQMLAQNLQNAPSINLSEVKPSMQDISGGVSEAFLRDFQAKTLGFLVNQNKLLLDLKDKNEVIQDTLACLIADINSLKQSVKQQATKDNLSTSLFPANPIVAHQALSSFGDTVTTETLLNTLYGPNQDFQYNLVLKSDLEFPLYRERNFKFTVVLTDKAGNVVENSNRIPLTLAIYSSENPPKFIDTNTAGNKILKGFIDRDLVKGSVTFEKIQIKEVTSHFRNGWVFFVVYPKTNTMGNNNILIGANGINVNIQKIKPLVIEKVVVKAKKAKEKGTDMDEKSPEEIDQSDFVKEEGESN